MRFFAYRGVYGGVFMWVYLGCGTGKWSLETFFPGAFCFHWHNQWNREIDTSSIFSQIESQLHKSLMLYGTHQADVNG